MINDKHTHYSSEIPVLKEILEYREKHYSFERSMEIINKYWKAHEEYTEVISDIEKIFKEHKVTCSFK